MPRPTGASKAKRSRAQGRDAVEPIRGEGKIEVGLRALDSTDIGALRALRNDWRIWRWCRQNDLISDVVQIEWFKRQANDPTIRMYAVTANGKLCGAAGLTSLDFANRRAEFSLYVAPELQGKGLGKAALRALLAHGFGNLGLNVIYGESFDGNPAIRLFERLGFVKEGTRREFYFKDGRMIDAHLYSMKASEWISQSAPSSAS